MITWTSQPGAVYSVEFSPDFDVWVELNDNVPSQGAETTYTDMSIPPGTTRRGYRVRLLP